jgi:hypothetical protein
MSEHVILAGTRGFTYVVVPVRLPAPAAPVEEHRR